MTKLKIAVAALEQFVAECEETGRTGGRKLILDGLVKAGVLHNDGAKDIRSWVDTFAVGSGAGVRVELTTAEGALRAVGMRT